jgi:hypothetical protein
MDLEEHSGVEPIIERRCAECGAELTDEEIKAAIDSDSAFLCTVHAAEQVEIEEEELPEN